VTCDASQCAQPLKAGMHIIVARNASPAGFPSKVEVEAHVVTLRNAALPGDSGVLNPLLEKWQDGALATRVFGLPVVHAVIQFKWGAAALSGRSLCCRPETLRRQPVAPAVIQFKWWGPPPGR